jgi:hypothetical protein
MEIPRSMARPSCNGHAMADTARGAEIARGRYAKTFDLRSKMRSGAY